jgi:hypothetical protein
VLNGGWGWPLVSAISYAAAYRQFGGWWPVFETAEQVRAAVRELTDAVWVLSAMAPVLAGGLEGPFSMDDPAARVLADYGLLEATEGGLVPRPGFAEAFGGRAERARDHRRRRSQRLADSGMRP